MKFVAPVFGFLLLPVFGQPSSTIASVGYATPKPVAVAPGQVITLFARTQTSVAQPLIATGSSLPTTLGGFSVTLFQTFSQAPIPVPILSVAPNPVCSGVVPQVCTTFTAITVQIPFELFPNEESSRLPENFALLAVSDNGMAGEPIALAPVSESIHIANSCDAPLNPQSGPCNPLFVHADGSPVTTKRPANPGETIRVRAYGLGYADSRLPTGQPSPSPAAGVSGVVMNLRFGTDLVVSRPGSNAIAGSAELVPGSFGLYQIPFQVPAIPDDAPACSAASPNLLVVIGRGDSFDGAGLCVAPPLPE